MNTSEILVSRKNALVLELQGAKERKDTKRTVRLASQAGALEREIAGLLVAAEQKDEAIVNLVSAGSCFVDARRSVEAARAFREALLLQPPGDIGAFLNQQLSELGALPAPGLVFSTVQAMVRGNDLLRRPQVEAYEAAARHFGNSKEHAIIQLPVGCGKTGTMSLLPFGIAKGRALVVAPNLEIAQNLQREFDYSDADSFLKKQKVLRNGRGPTCAVLDAKASVFDADASDFVVANIQQLVASGSEKWLSQFAPDYFDLVLFDEGHHNAADSWLKIHEKFPEAKFTSFTATPIRADGKKVEGAPIYRFPIAEAIREGYIKDIATRRLEPMAIEFVYEGSQRRHSLAELMELREKEWFSKGVALAPECNRNIADAAIQCMNELRSGSSHAHQIIAAACSIDHAKSIRSIFGERGLRADVLHSDLPEEEKATVRSKMRRQELDAIVHVQMLGEGADYPTLSVAAIFRPYRHLVPYVQFVGRIMRVVKQNAPGHPDNKGFVVSHVGLHIDRWWEELRQLDKDDQLFFESLAHSAMEFTNTAPTRPEAEGRHLFSHPMQVLDEQIERYVEEHFLDRSEAKIVAKDLIRAMALRGLDLRDLGVTEEQLAEHLIERELSGRVEPALVQPQRARQEAQRRLNERVRAGAKQLLNELGLKVGGRKLVKLYPHFQATADLTVAIILLNNEVNRFLGVGSEERNLLTEEQARSAHDAMDRLIDAVAENVRERLPKE